jgi:hypothetical protein
MDDHNEDHDRKRRCAPNRKGPWREPERAFGPKRPGGAERGVAEAYRVCDEYMRRGHHEAHHHQREPVTDDWNHWNDPHNINNAMRYYSHFLNMMMFPFVRGAQLFWDMNACLPGAANPFMRAHPRHPHPCHEAWRPHPPEPCATWHAHEPAHEPVCESDEWPHDDDCDFQEPEEWPDPFEPAAAKAPPCEPVCRIEGVVLIGFTLIEPSPQRAPEPRPEARGTLHLHTDPGTPTLKMFAMDAQQPALEIDACFFGRVENKLVLSLVLHPRKAKPGTYHGLIIDADTREQAGTLEIVVTNG